MQFEEKSAAAHRDEKAPSGEGCQNGDRLLLTWTLHSGLLAKGGVEGTACPQSKPVGW